MNGCWEKGKRWSKYPNNPSNFPIVQEFPVLETSPRDFWDAIDYCYFNHRIREAMKTLRLLKTDWLMDGLEPFKILILLKKFRPLKTIVIDGLSTSRKYSSLKETKCPLLTDSLTDWANSWDAIASKNYPSLIEQKMMMLKLTYLKWKRKF